MLEGGKETLKRVSGVLLELPIINIYKDNWRFHEAVAYMIEAGFVLAQVHPVNIHSRARDSRPNSIACSGQSTPPSTERKARAGRPLSHCDPGHSILWPGMVYFPLEKGPPRENGG